MQKQPGTNGKINERNSKTKCLFPNPVFVYTQTQMCTHKQKYTLCRLVTLSKTALFAVRYFQCLSLINKPHTLHIPNSCKSHNETL